MERSFLPRPRFSFMDHPRLFRLIVNIWPPYLGAAITVEEIASDWRTIRVAMRLRWYNCNYVKSHFGGSLFSMTDPFFMLMLIGNLGSEYVVWDMAARIQYLHPGHGTVTALFSLSDDRLEDIRHKAESGEKVTEIFLVDVVDGQGEKVAAVKKTLYIRRKRSAGADAGMEVRMENIPAGAVPSPTIVSAAWGKTEIAGLGLGKDWKLWPGGGRSWDWSEHGTGHFQGIQPGDLQELLDRGCRVVILTTGRLGRLKISPATIDTLEAQGIQVIVARTGKGIDIYNSYAGQRIAVGGLFHATC